MRTLLRVIRPGWKDRIRFWGIRKLAGGRAVSINTHLSVRTDGGTYRQREPGEPMVHLGPGVEGWSLERLVLLGSPDSTCVQMAPADFGPHDES